MVNSAKKWQIVREFGILFVHLQHKTTIPII